MDIFEILKQLNQPVPRPAGLPTLAEVREVEAALGYSLPPSYIDFQLNYSNVVVGTFELYSFFKDSPLYILRGIEEARKYYNLPNSFLPFLEDNGNYYCFDLRSGEKEPPIVFWSHDGITSESWVNFKDWVENCWIRESQG